MTPAGLLEIDRLRVSFPAGDQWAPVVRDVSLHVQPGEIVGLVGESGSGKTLTGLATLRLVPPPGRITGGRILLEGRDLLHLSSRAIREVRGRRIGMIFQEPMTALDPVFTVGSQVVEAIRAHERVSRSAARARAVELFARVAIPDPRERLDRYPHQLSGGQRQRAMIAIALASRPSLLIADEPTTALDVTLQARILELLRRLREELGLAILFITHDLGVVAELCDRVVVLYAGEVQEEATVEDLFARPLHPYSRALLGCVPRLGRPGISPGIPGRAPGAAELPSGCAFHPRCAEAISRCAEERPELVRGTAGSVARCLLVTPSEESG